MGITGFGSFSDSVELYIVIRKSPATKLQQGFGAMNNSDVSDASVSIILCLSLVLLQQLPIADQYPYSLFHFPVSL
jgi:hypothetical protein